MACAEAYIVSGAGTEACNGTYNHTGENGGKYAYEIVGGGKWIWWSGAFWYLSNELGAGTQWYYRGGECPDGEDWGLVNGEAPAPTVTEGPETALRTAYTRDNTDGWPELDISADITKQHQASYAVATKSWLSVQRQASYAVAAGVAEDTELPVVTIISPEEEEEVGGQVLVKFTVTDNVGVVSVRLYIDGNLQYEDDGHLAPDYEWYWDTIGWGNGNHTIKVIALDAAENEGSDEVNIVLNNTLANATRYLFTLQLPTNAPNPTKWRLSGEHGLELAIITLNPDDLPSDPQYCYNVTLGVHVPGDSVDFSEYQTIRRDESHGFAVSGASLRWGMKAMPQLLWAHWENTDYTRITRIVALPGGDLALLTEPAGLLLLSNGVMSVWEELSATSVADACYCDGKVIVAADDRLIAKDIHTGELTFDVVIPGIDAVDALVASDSSIYAATHGTEEDELYSFSYPALTKLATLPARAQTLAVMGSIVGIGGQNGIIYRYQNGEVVITYDTGQTRVNRLFADGEISWALTGAAMKLYRSTPSWQQDAGFGESGDLRGIAVYRAALFLGGDTNNLWRLYEGDWAAWAQLAGVAAIYDLYADDDSLFMATQHSNGARLYRVQIAEPGTVTCGPQPPDFLAKILRYAD